ncbi:MAG: peptidoglycan-binding protein [Oscillospiraceae bacterium]|nr:peptidoglycan-binding protein [Oscillospiraceae bacterium]
MVEVIIPSTITVHLGRPKEEAENVTIPFIDYIKNVASSEIYPTWPEAALRANIYAQVTFALNRVFTEWYRSQGYPFDITNSTQCDQAFEYGRDIFSDVSRIVDQLFNDYIRRIGTFEPLFAQYCNGTTTTCEGLSQWGTVDLANAGQVPFEILQNYYGDDIEIVRDAFVGEDRESYPGTPIRIGDTGKYPVIIQTSLNRISSNYPRIPKVTVDGRYGQRTAEAVRTFQEIFDLEPSGIVDKETWYRIARIYVSVKRLSELNSEGIKLEDVSKQFPEPLSIGSSGAGVRVLQFFLSYIAAFNDFIPTVNIDGSFGAATEEAVRAFQRSRGLEENGVVDEETWNQIYFAYRDVLEKLPPSTAFPLTEPYPGVDLRQGMSGESVRLVQEYLNYISLFFRDISIVAPTGYFGPATTASVRRFQSEFGLNADGIVNEQTWDEIASVYSDLRMVEVRQNDQAPASSAVNQQ